MVQVDRVCSPSCRHLVNLQLLPSVLSEPPEEVRGFHIIRANICSFRMDKLTHKALRHRAVLANGRRGAVRQLRGTLAGLR